MFIHFPIQHDITLSPVWNYILKVRVLHFRTMIIHSDTADLLEAVSTAFSERNFHLVRNIIGENESLVHARDDQDHTPLFYSVIKGPAEMAQYLLEKGAEVNARGYLGVTPLQYLLYMALPKSPEEEPPHVCEVAKVLLEAGADPNALDEERSPVWSEYIMNGSPKTMKVLLDYGYNLYRLNVSCRDLVIHVTKFVQAEQRPLYPFHHHL